MKAKNGSKKTEENEVPETPKIPLLISFRLDSEQAESLSSLASEEGLSSHQMAHDLVLKALWQHKRGVVEEPKALARQIFELREELALVTEKLLARAGKMSEEEAARWADDNMRAARKMAREGMRRLWPGRHCRRPNLPQFLRWLFTGRADETGKKRGPA